PFRLQQLLARLQKLHPAISAVHATRGYFIQSEPLNATELQRLQQLLPEATLAKLPTMSSHCCAWVVPRLGTISPWSSKATDIAHNCELTKITRIEHGIFFQIEGITQQAVAAHEELKKQLYDPLTESLLFNVNDLNRLFESPTAQTFSTVPADITALKEANV